jgi:hypothetical protein
MSRGSLSPMPTIAAPRSMVRTKMKTSNIMFDHCGGATFYAALHELADRSGSMIFWPSLGRSLAATRSDVIVHIPADVAELGPPHVVSDGGALEHCIMFG